MCEFQDDSFQWWNWKINSSFSVRSQANHTETSGGLCRSSFLLLFLGLLGRPPGMQFDDDIKSFLVRRHFHCREVFLQCCPKNTVLGIRGEGSMMTNCFSASLFSSWCRAAKATAAAVRSAAWGTSSSPRSSFVIFRRLWYCFWISSPSFLSSMRGLFMIS